MVYAVIDTNVIVSALITRSPQSPVLQVIQRILSGRVCTLVNNEILAEYKEVLARPKFNLEQETVETVISELLKHSLNVDAPPSGVVLPDPKDVVFYNVVLAKRDDGAYLITGNTKHFPVCGFVVTPREFLDIVDAPLCTMFVNDRRMFYNANPVASRMLHTMQQLSADAEKAGSAGMTLDEINAEIAAARSGK